MAKYLEKMYSGEQTAVEKAEDKTKESLWKRGKAVAKDFWEGKNGFGSKIGNRAAAIGVPALAATAGTVYALRKKAAKAAADADELEAATEQNFSERIYNDAFEAGYMYAQREFAEKEGFLERVKGRFFGKKEAEKESLLKRGKGVAKDFWEGKNGFGNKIGNRAAAISAPALAATAGTVYALRKKAAAANAAADELEAAAEED